MEHHFRILLSHKELAAIRAIAKSVWPPTFREILSPEQITYMMKMMYGPEVLEREFDRGIYFEVLSMMAKTPVSSPTGTANTCPMQ